MAVTITTKLLSLILAKDAVSTVVGMLEHPNNSSLLAYQTLSKINDGKRTINIHELAQKCKDYAIEHWDAVFNSSTYQDGAVCSIQYGSEGKIEQFNNDKEWECIIEATQWFIDGKKPRPNRWSL